MSFGSLAAKAFLCCASIGCLVGAVISFLLASRATHEQHTKQYIDAVEAWEPARREFDGLRVTFGRANATVGPLRLDAVSPADALRGGEDAWELPSYSTLIYRLTQIPEALLPKAVFSELQVVSDTERWGISPVLTIDVGGDRIFEEAVPLILASARREGSTSRSCGGLASGGWCWTYQALDKLCIQVALSDTANGKRWSLSPRTADNRSYGCDYAAAKWKPAIYRSVPVLQDLSVPDPQRQSQTASGDWVRMDGVVIEVYSSSDPYFRALELTEGELRFGMTSYEENVLGFVLLAMCTAFACPACCSYCRYRYKQRNRFPHRYRSSTGRRWNDPNPETVGMKLSVDRGSPPPSYDVSAAYEL